MDVLSASEIRNRGVATPRSAAAAICALPLVILSALTSTAAAEGIQGDAELLKQVADAWSANKAGIRTWRGSAVVKDTTTRGGAPDQDVVSDITFAFDAARPAKRWNWTYREWTRHADGAAQSDPAQFPHSWSSGMLKEGAFYSVIKIPQAQRPSITINPPEKVSIGPASPTFDPMFFLFDQGENLSGLMRFLHENAQLPQMNVWSITKDGSQVTVDCRTEAILNRYVADLASGGLLVEHSGYSKLPGETVVDKSTYRHEKVNGVWIPNFFRYDHAVTTPAGETTSLRTIDWKTNIVNETLADAEFEYPALGVQNGDEIFDTRSRVTTTFGLPEPAQLVPQPSKPAADMPPPLPASKPTPKWMLIVGNLCALAAVGFGLWYRARRRPRS